MLFGLWGFCWWRGVELAGKGCLLWDCRAVWSVEGFSWMKVLRRKSSFTTKLMKESDQATNPVMEWSSSATLAMQVLGGFTVCPTNPLSWRQSQRLEARFSPNEL